MADAKKAGSMLGKDLHVTRTAAHGHSFGCWFSTICIDLNFWPKKHLKLTIGVRLNWPIATRNSPD